MRRDEVFPVRTLGFLVLVSLLLWGLDFWGVMRPVRRVFEWSLSPLREVTSEVSRRLASTFTFVRAARFSQARLTDLERKVAELSVDAARAKEAIRENEAMRQLLGANVSGLVDMDLLPARVVGRGEKWLVAVGRGENVTEGAGVVSEQGVLVGRLGSVGEFVSRVALKTEPGFAVAAITETGVTGVVVGESGRLVLTEILQEERVSPGQLVMTSGADDRLPEGLVLGEVREVRLDPAAVYTAAELEPLFSEHQAKYLFILVN